MEIKTHFKNLKYEATYLSINRKLDSRIQFSLSVTASLLLLSVFVCTMFKIQFIVLWVFLHLSLVSPPPPTLPPTVSGAPSCEFNVAGQTLIVISVVESAPERGHGYPRVLELPAMRDLSGGSCLSTNAIYQQLNLSVARSWAASTRAASTCMHTHSPLY